MSMGENDDYTGIVILNYNNYQDTINCVKSIDRHNRTAIKLIVIDNGSTQKDIPEKLDFFFQERYKENYLKIGEDEVCDGRLPYLTFLISKSNSGYAKGNNKGLQLAYHDMEIKYVMILNNDVLFVSDIIGGLKDAFSKLERCAVVSPLLRCKDGVTVDTACARKLPTPNQIILRYLTLNFRLPYLYSHYLGPAHNMLLKDPTLISKDYFEVEVISGSCFMMKKQLLQDMDSLDPHTFLYYEEDILSQKISSMNLKSYVVTTFSAIHLGGSTAQKYNLFCAKANLDSAVYYIRNYYKLNLPQRFLLALAVKMMKVKFWIYGICKKRNR